MTQRTTMMAMVDFLHEGRHCGPCRFKADSRTRRIDRWCLLFDVELRFDYSSPSCNAMHYRCARCEDFQDDANLVGTREVEEG